MRYDNRIRILGRAFNIALDNGLSNQEKSRIAGKIGSIPGISITDTSCLETSGYRTPSRYITAPSEGMHFGGQFSGSQEKHEATDREIRNIPGVRRLVWF